MHKIYNPTAQKKTPDLSGAFWGESPLGVTLAILLIENLKETGNAATGILAERWNGCFPSSFI